MNRTCEKRREFTKRYTEVHPWRSRSLQSQGWCLVFMKWRLKVLFIFLGATVGQQTLADTTVTATEGQPASLNCTPSDINSPGVFIWIRQDNQPLSANQTGSVLHLTNVTQHSAGVYICNHTLSNSSTSTLHRIYLIVHYPAKVSRVLPATNPTFRYGETIRLACIMDAVPATNKTTWTKNGEKWQEGNSNLTIVNAQCSDAGEYECFPSNGLQPSLNGSFTVRVVGPPDQVATICFPNKTARTVQISWEPGRNGCLSLTYSLKWRPILDSFALGGNTSVGGNTSFQITRLSPHTKYGVWVKVHNSAGKSASKGQHFITKAAAPSKPINVNATEGEINKINVSWQAPLEVNGPLKELQYKLFFQAMTNKNSTEWKIRDNIKDLTSLLTNISAGVTYYIKIQAYNAAGYSEDSETVSGKAKIINPKDRTSVETPAGVIAVAVIVSIVLVVGLILLVLLLRHRYQCKMPLRGFFNFEDRVEYPAQRITSFTKKEDKREPVPYEGFRSHVALLHADCDYKFFTEFEAIQGVHEKNKKVTWVQSQKPDNQTKNRYANVVAYDHSRVVLSLNERDTGSHYINANYIDSYKTMNSYIATQGPLAKTIGDFWRMIWEQNCRVIVMITNIIEKGRHKCAQYWPTKNKKTGDHGPLRVTFLDEECFAFHTVRTFEVKPIKDGSHYSQDPSDDELKPIIVRQFHFTGWPDHGAPEPGHEFPVLDFICKSTTANPGGAGPIVVHCSAGVGRSGAFIVIDSMIKRIHDNGDIDIFNFLAHIRQQRNHLVQEECQYIFAHDALLQYISCNFLLSIPIKALKGHVHSLRTAVHSQTTGKTKMKLEYEEIAFVRIKEYNLKEVKKPCNICKNRNNEILPVDSCRVKLYPRPGEEGSDYINASYIDGFLRREAYIATQYPLETTMFDFWRMIWQENCRSVVMLLSKEEWDKSVYPQYLPVVHDTARFGAYEVTMESETARGDFMIRDLKMISVNDPSVTRKIRHFHFLHWPENAQPWSGQTILQLVSKVDEWERAVRSNSQPFEMIGPIVVHCNTGVGRTGVYCTLHTLWHQISREEVVSLYQTAWLHAHQRPKLLQTLAHYEMCYDTLVEYIDADCSLYLV